MKTPCGWRLALPLVPSLFLAHVPAFAFSVFTVGPAADCPYHSIQDAVNAAAGTAGVDYVWISNNLVSGARYNYVGQHIRVNDPDGVVIEGGFVSCADPNIDANENTTISGAGNDGGPVFDISSAGGDVFLGNLFITGANRAGDGGGIAFIGQVGGALILKNTIITGNHAGYGAGINVNGANSPAALVLEDNNLIDFNTAATSGGGIRVEGNTRLYALSPQTLIGYNHADGGYGGGIEVIAPARADIGSPGYNGLAAIYGNSALYGGGIAGVEDNNANPSQVRVFTVDAEHPVAISDNTASASGGALYVGGLQSYNNLCLYDFRIDDNTAPDGAAIYVNTLGRVGINANPFESGADSCVSPEPPPQLGAVACALDAPCNEIDRNVAEDTSGNPTEGSAISVQSDAWARGDRLRMQRNEGGHVIGAFATGFDTSSVDLNDCLLTDNVSTRELIATGSDGISDLSMKSCTIAGNAVGAPFVFLSYGEFSLHNSIIDQPQRATVDEAGDSTFIYADYVLTNDTATLLGHIGVAQGEPAFVDAGNGDYHLAPNSMGLDFAPSGTGSDLDRNPRTVDLSAVVNLYGSMDLGAYELQSVPACSAADTIFCSGFEAYP